MDAFEPYRVLLVDDDNLALKLAHRIFEDDEDIILTTTISANEALTNPRADLDLIISDHRMPEMPGLLFLARMAEVVPDAMRVMLTAFPDISVAMEGINKGLLHRLVVKPWDPEEMRNTVREDLRKQRIARRNAEISDRLREWFDDFVYAERLAVAAGVGTVLGGLNAMLGHGARDLHEQHTTLVAQLDKIDEGTTTMPKARSKARSAAGAIAESVEIISRSSEELTQLTQRLVRDRELPVTGDRWDPNDAIRIAAELLGDRFPQGAPRLSFDALPLIDTPGSDILRIAVHLLANAAEATDPHKLDQVAVKTIAEKREIRIEVSNPGVTAIQPKELFRPLRSQQEDRLGLGLSICRALVDLAGGSVDVFSTKGITRVVVTLPVRARPSSRPSVPPR